MAINISVQYNGGLLPVIILHCLLTQGYYHRGTRLKYHVEALPLKLRNSILSLPCWMLY